MLGDLSVILSLIVIGINIPFLCYLGNDLLRNRDRVRRGLKLLLTGKYEPPKETQ